MYSLEIYKFMPYLSTANSLQLFLVPPGLTWDGGKTQWLRLYSSCRRSGFGSYYPYQMIPYFPLNFMSIYFITNKHPGCSRTAHLCMGIGLSFGARSPHQWLNVDFLLFIYDHCCCCFETMSLFLEMVGILYDH